MLDLRRADPERERAERAVRRGVAVAADDRHPRLREPELGADHVDDSLAAAAGRVQRDAELLAVPRAARRAAPCASGSVIGAVHGRHVVIHRRDGEIGAPHAPPVEPQPVERLRRGHLVDQVQVDVEQRRLAGLLADDVRVPDLLEQRLAPSDVSTAAGYDPNTFSCSASARACSRAPPVITRVERVPGEHRVEAVPPRRATGSAARRAGRGRRRCVRAAGSRGAARPAGGR